MYGRLLIWTHCLENERQEKCIAMEAEKRVDCAKGWLALRSKFLKIIS